MHCMAVESKNETEINAEFVNIGGGIGVNYPPDDKPTDLRYISSSASEILVRRSSMNAVIWWLVITVGWWHLLQIRKTLTYGVEFPWLTSRFPGLMVCTTRLSLSKVSFFQMACSGAFPILHTTVVGDSYAWPNHEGDKREQMLELVGSTCTSSNKFAVDRILNVILNWRCPVLAVTHWAVISTRSCSPLIFFGLFAGSFKGNPLSPYLRRVLRHNDISLELWWNYLRDPLSRVLSSRETILGNIDKVRKMLLVHLGSEKDLISQ